MRVMGGPRSLKQLGALGLVSAALLGPRSAQAQARPSAPSEPSRVIWSSSPGCSSEAAFLAELRSRTSRLRPAREGEHATMLIVEMMREQGGVHGALTVRKSNGDLLTREVPGPNCQEVTSAMALIAALMVDPLAAMSDAVAPPPPLPPPPPARRAWSLRADVRLTARTAVAPGLAWGESLGATGTWEAQRFRPSLKLSAHRARGTASRASGSAELRWSAAEIALCPWGAQPGERWDVHACAVFQLGSLRGRGYQTLNPAEKSIIWSAAGVELEGRVKLVGPLWAGLDAAIVRPFTHESFYLEPADTLFRVPKWGYGFGAGLGLLFF